MWYVCYPVETEQIQEPVAFTAAATTHQSFSTSTVAKFDKVLLNLGNHYDPAVSLFTCPVKGLYFVSVKVDGNNKAAVQLEVLNAGLRMFYLWAGGHSAYPSVSGSAMVECLQGNKIWVQSIAGGQIYAQAEANIFSILLVTTTS